LGGLFFVHACSIRVLRKIFAQALSISHQKASIRAEKGACFAGNIDLTGEMGMRRRLPEQNLP
jgi:hypothetical protein